MSRATDMLAEFHEHPNAQDGRTNDPDLRATLHEEEHEELLNELEYAREGNPNLHQIARKIADVLYVTYGTAWAFGIDADAALEEVHRAAMDKMRATGANRALGEVPKDVT